MKLPSYRTLLIILAVEAMIIAAFLTASAGASNPMLEDLRECMEAQHDFDVEYGVVGHYDNVSICKNAVAEPEWRSYDKE